MRAPIFGAPDMAGGLNGKGHIGSESHLEGGPFAKPHWDALQISREQSKIGRG